MNSLKTWNLQMKIPSHLSKSWSHNQIIFSKMSGRSSVLLLLDFIE